MELLWLTGFCQKINESIQMKSAVGEIDLTHSEVNYELDDIAYRWQLRVQFRDQPNVPEEDP